VTSRDGATRGGGGGVAAPAGVGAAWATAQAVVAACNTCRRKERESGGGLRA
jgi:hypothetical protein